MIEAIRDAMDVCMERDENVVVFGEDVGFFGGVFRCTKGLQEKYGRHRCFDTPINESGIVGAAIGMAACGPTERPSIATARRSENGGACRRATAPIHRRGCRSIRADIA